jgi:hypothetical protein
MLSGALPTLSSFELSKGSLPPNSASLNCEIISRRSTRTVNTLPVTENQPRTDREDAHDTVDGNTDHTFTFLGGTSSDDLDANVDRRLLTKPYNLCASPPIPANERLVGASRD